MQTSKIIMSASALVLAVAGAFATKSANRSAAVSAWSRVSATDHTCVVKLATVTCKVDAASSNFCRTSANSIKTVYTRKANNKCDNTLKTAPDGIQ